MTAAIEVLRDPERFGDRQRRMLGALIKRAIQHGQLHERDNDWLARTITAGEARAVLLNGSLLGFFALRTVQDPVLGRIVYGSACLWRTSEPTSEAAVHAAVIAESARLEADIYGSFFSNNAAAATFYSAGRGWQRVTAEEFPPSIGDDIARYGDDLVLVRRPVRDESHAT